ncbi:Na+/H+ antiporter NhaC [Streptomyces sp. NBC_00006]|uniref:Na+/H+ antiporter NhaC n=1 Tax=Streptomyces sp. NBC_00006 TaxID=2975619 RepID=UPI00225129CA|nr:Na+/H+ antiporter NhaC [Streptomyces sp. NBC_00006]MCX5529098.1 Na+/H+ antiporter NhaC [Streptomyces sp. NBC_00006]
MPETAPVAAPRRTPTFLQALAPIAVMIALLVVGTVWLGLDPVILLIVASSFAGVYALWFGLSWEQMLIGIRRKIDSTMPALLILISIGMLTGTWMISGTIPMVVDYGLQVIEPHWILPVSFLVTVVVSTLTGTSWGSVGTVGVALISVAGGLGASLPMTAGAIVAGAYFGDKMSPLSDTTNLAPVVAGANLFEHIRHLLYTTVPAAVVSLIAYFFLGLSMDTHASQGTGKQTEELLGFLDKAFTFSPLLLLPPLVVLVGAVLRKPPLPTIILSSVVAAVLGGVVQGFSLSELSTAASEGFNSDMLVAHGWEAQAIPETARTLLDRGGLSSMTSVVLIGLAGFAFAGIITEAGFMDVLITRLLHRVRRTGGIVLATVGSSIGVALATGTSYLTILIPGEGFKQVYADKGLAPKNLSRTLEDSGTVMVPLIPWSEAAMYMSTTLGVATISYAPYAFLCYLGAVFAVICGYTGIGIARNSPTPSDRPTSTEPTASTPVS